MRAITFCFWIELKKGWKVFLKSFISTLILLIALVLGLFFISFILYKSSVFSPVEVGVVLPEEDDNSKMVSQLISSMDSVKSICRFHYLDVDTALNQLEDGQLQGIIEIPESYFQDTNKSTPILLYLPEDNSANVEVFGELVNTGVTMLQTAESGIYATYKVAKTNEISIERDEVGDVIIYLYMEFAFKRNQMFNQTIISSLGDMDVSQYYFASAMTIFLLLCGLNYGVFYGKQEKVVGQKLKLYGIGRLKLMLIKVTVMTIMLFGMELGIYLIGSVISNYLGKTFLEIDHISILSMIPLCFGIAGFFHLIYSVSQDGKQGTVLLLLMNFFMILGSGAIIPIAYLPEAIANIGKFLPLTFWNQLCANGFFGNMSVTVVLFAMGIGLVEIIVGELIACGNI